MRSFQKFADQAFKSEATRLVSGVREDELESLYGTVLSTPPTWPIAYTIAEMSKPKPKL